MYPDDEHVPEAAIPVSAVRTTIVDTVAGPSRATSVVHEDLMPAIATLEPEGPQPSNGSTLAHQHDDVAGPSHGMSIHSS